MKTLTFIMLMITAALIIFSCHMTAGPWLGTIVRCAIWFGVPMAAGYLLGRSRKPTYGDDAYLRQLTLKRSRP